MKTYKIQVRENEVAIIQAEGFSVWENDLYFYRKGKGGWLRKKDELVTMFAAGEWIRVTAEA